MNKFDILRTAGGLVIGGGIGTIVGNVIKHTTPEKVKFGSKISIAIGSAALTGYLSMKSAEYAEKQIEAIIISFRTGIELGKNAAQAAS